MENCGTDKVKLSSIGIYNGLKVWKITQMLIMVNNKRKFFNGVFQTGLTCKIWSAINIVKDS